MLEWRSEVFHGCPAASARYLVHCQQAFLYRAGTALLDQSALEAVGGSPADAVGLGYLSGVPVHLWQAPVLVEGAGLSWVGLRQLLAADLAPAQLSMLRYASQIGTWLSRNRYCGSCGAGMLAHPGERAMVCPVCSLQQYPVLSPCMIVLVTDGDRLLLARSSRHAAGMYSTLAGFVEPGETVEQCVAREVLEEVGIRIRDIRYVGSQNWPFPHSLMLAFRASYAGGSIVPQPGEIEDAGWFRFDQLPLLPGKISIARYLIDSFVAERTGTPAPDIPF